MIESFIPITNMIVFRVRERRKVAGFHRQIMEAVTKRDPVAATKALATCWRMSVTATQPQWMRATG